MLAEDYQPNQASIGRAISLLERATSRGPSLSRVWLRYGGALLRAGRWTEARAALNQGLRYSLHPLERLPLYNALARIHQQSGDQIRADALARALAMATERDGRPGVLLEGASRLRFLAPRPGRSPTVIEVLEERRKLVASGQDLSVTLGVLATLGANLSDGGKPLEALPLLTEVLRIADSVQWPDHLAMAYRIRGRAQTKLGRLGDAERDLLAAVAASEQSGDSYQLAEAYHNLAHVYEGMNRLDDAVRIADRFVAVTRGMRGFQPNMMSLRDAGLIRWKAGRPAAAAAAFSAMVQAVDYQERNHYWAGEYFERLGDLPRALEYYRRGLSRDPAERSLNLAGLARVFDAMGQPDSAETAAGYHDDVMSDQLDYPLLPAILARKGEVDRAIEVASSWAATLNRRGNLQGAARATVALADLLLEVGRLREAVDQALAADALARRVNLTDESLLAARVLGLALVRMGKPDSGLGVLRAAAARADRSPAGESVLRIQLARGEALTAMGAGRTREALLAYDRAARSVELGMPLMVRDLDRARYRGRQVAPFTGAIRALLNDQAVPGRLDALATWSERRKAAALSFATGVSVGPNPGRPDTNAVVRLQHRLEAGELLVDYQVVDQQVAALVVARSRAEVVILPVLADTLSAAIDRLWKPMSVTHAGRLDLARAIFDTATAARLHQVLIAPVIDRFGPAERLLLVPDGPLHLLPFDALVLDTGDNGPVFLVDRVELIVLPSTRFLSGRSATRPRPQQQSVLAVGHRAPQANEEIQAIAAAWPNVRVQLLGGDGGEPAAETLVRRQAGDYAILHFATHAAADDREPEASHLRLLPDAENDGYLHPTEIETLRLPGSIVVLSACETLSGPLYTGEGLMGLARGFLAAGARTVVATRWPVGPAMARLMASYHRRLAAGALPSGALREAKLELRLDPATAHPFFWAGLVVLEGSGRGQ